MNSRNVVHLFFSTLLIGAATTLVTSFFVKADMYRQYFQPIDMYELSGIIVFFVAYGLVFSLISQMGFFAYLTINQFGLGMFKSFWPVIQLVLIAFTLFDLIYFRYKDNEDGSLLIYSLVAVVLVVYSWIIARIKAKQTNNGAFIPALFFMVVVTSIEWVPGLRVSGGDYAWLMIIPLLICNTYQLLILHKLINQSSNKKGDK